ncbi:hypothetical protein QL285_052088 [Trifolium repens]|nr:hypothetical protein QL285_052088 [Trifolium repens]
MSQQSSKNNNSNPDDSKTQTEEVPSQMPRVSDLCVDQQRVITNDVPISMIPPTEGEIKKKKSKRSTKKTKKGIDHENINSEPKPFEEPEQDVKTSGEALTTTSPDEHQNKTSESADLTSNTTRSTEDFLNIPSGPQEEKVDLTQTLLSEEVITQDVEPNVPTSGSAPISEQEKVQDLGQDDEDEVPVAKILQGMKKSGEPHESMEEESSEESEGIRISIPVKGIAKTYRSKQVETPITEKKGKRKAEKKAVGEKSSKKKKQVVAESDSDTDVEVNVLDITTSGKKRIGGRRVPANIPPAPMERVSFHSEESAQRWRFVYQRRVAQERELSQEALECK